MFFNVAKSIKPNSKFLNATCQVLTSKCNVSLQEYQSKKLLQEHGVNIQRFQMAATPEEAHDAGKNLMNTIAS